MNTLLKTTLAILTASAISTLAYSAHYAHNWKKVSEQEGINGQVVCQWQCGMMGSDVHYATTAGYGNCPQKW